ncbi:hypothetical protein FALBO_8892 [Fusarium albosuccineum]|uniref:Uncharacterized protein n=1 Tax=Fusarium albosuccineum TaxID=1237068 RepID=A0A8H4LAD3_9HYPO|nr:hypothetical protein FALBO_8892 [Fusarium albosuccineum]
MGSDDSLAGTWSALKEDFSCPLAGVAGSVSSSWDQSPGHGGLVVRGGCRAVSVLAGVWATSLTAVAKEVICRREVVWLPFAIVSVCSRVPNFLRLPFVPPFSPTVSDGALAYLALVQLPEYGGDAKPKAVPPQNLQFEPQPK